MTFSDISAFAASTPWFARLVSASLFFAAATVLFLFLCMRFLLHIRDGLAKRVFIRALVVVLILLAVWGGWQSGFSGALWIPVALLTAAGVGEVHRLATRHRLRGAPPVEVVSPRLSLLRPFTTCDLAYRRYEVGVPSWSTGRFRVAHLSDFHVNSTLPLAFYEDAVARAVQSQPDLVALTGDFVTDTRFIPLLSDLFSRCRARFGTVAVLGNHDYWADAEGIAAALASAGVKRLGPAGMVIEAAPGCNVLIAGCEAPWGDSQVPMSRGDVPVVVLTHTVDNIFQLAAQGVHTVLAGHTHGGQGNLPWYGPLVVPSRYGRAFHHGHYVVRKTHLFVTSGVGVAAPPLRVYCQPEVVVVDFLGGNGRYPGPATGGAD